MENWQHKTFDQLSVDELFEILKVRQQVFIIELQCIYPDIDEIDRQATHLFLRSEENKSVSVYLRILAPGLKGEEASLGRVLTGKTSRGKGLGRRAMIEAIGIVESAYLDKAIKISAQTYLERFYQDLGFATVSEPYDDDGIMHIDMIRQSSLRSA